MRINLGTHHNAITRFDRMIEFVRLTQPPVVKILDIDVGFVQAVRTISPSSLIVGRDAHNVDVLANPRGAAEEKLTRLQARADWSVIDTWEGNNEPDTYNWETFVAYGVFERHLADLLHAEAKRYVALSWGEGHPPRYGEDPAFPWWNFVEHYAPVLERADFLGLHEYGFPRMNSPGMIGLHVLRFPRWYEQLPSHLRKPIIITECSLTNAVGGFGPDVGYKEWLSDEEYAEDIIWYGERLNDYPYVIGFCPFCDGTRDSQWDSFDWTETVVTRLVEYQISGGPEPILPPEDIIDIIDQLPKHATLRYKTRPLEAIRYLVVHHTVSSPSTTPEATATYHISPRPTAPNGWPGIGYHYWVAANGQISQVNDLTLQSYHCKDHNREAIGICLPGSFHGDRPGPPEAQLHALEHLIETLQHRLLILDSGIQGHYELSATLCPGSQWFEAWRDSFLGIGDGQLDVLRRENAELRQLLERRQEEILELNGVIDEVIRVAQSKR